MQNPRCELNVSLFGCCMDYVMWRMEMHSRWHHCVVRFCLCQLCHTSAHRWQPLGWRSRVLPLNLHELNAALPCSDFGQSLLMWDRNKRRSMNTFFVCIETTISCSASLECAAKFTSMIVFTFNFCYYCTLRNSSFSPLQSASYQHSLTHSKRQKWIHKTHIDRSLRIGWLCDCLHSSLSSNSFLLFFFRQWLRFYYMSVPFCCVRCACINSTKTKSSRSERERGGERKCKFCIFFSFLFYWKLNVLISFDILIILLIFSPIHKSICMVCAEKATEQYNGDFCCKREKNRLNTKRISCSPNWTVI